MIIVCAFCGDKAEKSASHVNRSRSRGNAIYCSRKCSGLARRTGKTPEQKKKEKRLYDIKYREDNQAMLKAKKAKYHKSTYDPVAAAEHRKSRMAAHVEYCRRPEYREWKREYDRHYRAKKDYGEFAECFLLTMDIRAACLAQSSDYEIRLEKGTLNKHQTRRRDYERLDRKEPEVGPLGNLERC